MIINTENAIIKYSTKGHPFQYDKLFYATVEKYILEYKNARLEKLTEADVGVCLARIIRKMEVNDVPVQKYFHKKLDDWKDDSNRERIDKLIDVISHDIFCCFDRNVDNADGSFKKVSRIYSVNNDGEKDYIVCESMEKKGLFKKEPSAESRYFSNLMDMNRRGLLSKIETEE